MFALWKGYSECKMSLDDVIAEHHEGTLRERKKQATRRALRKSALDLFAAKGFSKVTVEDIAAAADVSPRTFFNYFPSKEAVLLGFDPQTSEHIREQIVAQPSCLSPLEALDAVLADEMVTVSEELREMGRDAREVFELMKTAADDPDFRAARAAQAVSIEHSVTEGLAERLGVDAERDPYPYLLATCAIAAVKTAIFLWGSGGGGVPLATLTRSALRSIGKGLDRGCEPLRNVFEKGESTK